MFLLGLFGLAAMGGAAYAISDVFSGDEDEDNDDVIEEDAVEDIPEGNLLEIDDSFEDPAEGASHGTILSDVDGNLVIAGGPGVDVLSGAEGNDQINGYDGGDIIDGGAGNDTLFGADGDDSVNGNTGDDILHGGNGHDDLSGNAGDDILYGHAGDDRLVGGEGDDDLFGGQGNDDLAGGEGEDALQGGDGEDMLAGGAGADTLFGGDGDDTLTGRDDGDTPASDFLNGGTGDDTILAGAGDVVTGGQGADQIAIDRTATGKEVSVVDFTPGEDKLLIEWNGPDAPEIGIEQDADNADLTRVLVNGREVAYLFGAQGLGPEDIQLTPGLDPALTSPSG